MELIIIKGRNWKELANRLERIERALERVNHSHLVKEKRDWLPLTEFFKYSTISRASWYREYQYKIKYRNDGVKIWVNIPSYENYLEEKAINK